MVQLDERQAEVVAKLREIADKSVAPHAADVDREGRFPSEALAALAKGGFYGLTVPTEFGGMGQGLRVTAAVLDELAQRDASTAMVYLMHLCGVACYAANPSVASEQLSKAAVGEHLSTLAWSERGSRSHFWAPVSQATASNGHVTLNAEKSFVTSAGKANGYVVSTKSPNASGMLDTTLYLVQDKDPGVNVDGPWEALGMKGNASAPMKLVNCEIGSDRALSKDGAGFQMMLETVLPLFQIGSAAISIGIAEAAVAATTKHLTGASFKESNTKLADLPNLRARLAQMRIETDRARAHLNSVLSSVENPGPATMLMVLESKAAAAETALKVTDLAMQACGGAAFSKSLPLERNFRDARAASVMAPTSDVLQDFIGRALCGMELF